MTMLHSKKDIKNWHLVFVCLKTQVFVPDGDGQKPPICGHKNSKSPKKVGKSPVLKSKVATKNSVFSRVVAFVVKNPLYFFINAREKTLYF